MKKEKIIIAFLLMISFCLTNIFAESEEELKKRILKNADLNGASVDELMQGDITDESNGSFLDRFKKHDKVQGEREVPFTQELYDFIETHFSHNITDLETRNFYYNKAVESANKASDEYAKEVLLARCDYFCGMNVMESYDLTQLENMDLSDNSSAEPVNEIAGRFYDSGIEHALKAMEIKDGTDAPTIYAHCISANCTAKTVSYVLANGLKVRKFAKIAVKRDYSNGTAHFLASAQDAYAPAPFNKLKRARKEFLSYLNDDAIRMEKFDYLNIYSGIAYTYYKKNKFNDALTWYKKALEIYPNNYSVLEMIGKINKLVEKKNKKKK